MNPVPNIALRIVCPAVLLALVGCHRVSGPASVIHMDDPETARQLLAGFYGVEGGTGDQAWRWTTSDFSLALAPPGNSTHGARLRLKLYFPETQIHKLGPMTLTASIDGQPLKPETFSNGGAYDFVRDVPACFLDTNVLPVSFSFDRYLPKSDTEGRDLGAVVLMAALEPK